MLREHPPRDAVNRPFGVARESFDGGEHLRLSSARRAVAERVENHPPYGGVRVADHFEDPIPGHVEVSLHLTGTKLVDRRV